MSLEGAIPCKLFVSRFPCRVWYRDQLQVCSICEDPAHRAADCPLRGLCRKCRQPGHVERNCPSSAAPDLAPADPAPSSASTDAAPPVSPAVAVPLSDSAPDVDVSSADTDPSSAEASDSESCSGDEEVLQSAKNVSLSPRRTRSSVPVSGPPSEVPATDVSVAASLASNAPVDPPVSASAAPVSPVVAAVTIPPSDCVVAVADAAAPSIVDPGVVAYVKDCGRYSQKAILIADHPKFTSVLDFFYLTPRVCSDTATFEMWRETYYSEKLSTKVVKPFLAHGPPIAPATVLPPCPPSKFPV